MADKTEIEKVSLRIPGSLKTDLEAIAAGERRSLNQQVVVILEASIKKAKAFGKPASGNAATGDVAA